MKLLEPSSPARMQSQKSIGASNCPLNSLKYETSHFQQLRDSQLRVNHLEQELGQRAAQQDNLAEEKIRLLREIAKLKAGRGHLDNLDATDSSAAVRASNPVSPSEAALKSVGSLRLYEITLGVFFIALIINWTMFPN